MKIERALSSENKIRIGLLLVSLFIMLWNTFAHPPMYSYDYDVHWYGLRFYQGSNFFNGELPSRLSYNPVLYYGTASKINRIIEWVMHTSIDPFYMYRLMHLTIFGIFYWMFSKYFLHRLINSSLARICCMLAWVAVPNLFLSQLMVRADWLAWPAMAFLFYLMCLKDQTKSLAHSNSNLLGWGLGLIILANSRHIVLPAWGVFFIIGVFNIWKCRAKLSTGRSLIVLIVFLGTMGLSSAHYINRFSKSGLLTELDVVNQNNYQIGQSYYNRGRLFFNIDFVNQLRVPDRRAHYDGDGALFPKLWSDFTSDHWLYFSGRTIQKKWAFIKQASMVVNFPFFVVFIWAMFLAKPKYYSVSKIVRGDPIPTLALLWVLGFASFLGFVWTHPYFPTNEGIKYSYLLGYSWIPPLLIAHWLDQKKLRTQRRWLRYLWTVYLFGLPLMIYWIPASQVSHHEPCLDYNGGRKM